MTNMIKASEQEKKNETKSTQNGSMSKLDKWCMENGFPPALYNTKKGCCVVMSKKPKKVNR